MTTLKGCRMTLGPGHTTKDTAAARAANLAQSRPHGAVGLAGPVARTSTDLQGREQALRVWQPSPWPPGEAWTSQRRSCCPRCECLKFHPR